MTLSSPAVAPTPLPVAAGSPLCRHKLRDCPPCGIPLIESRLVRGYYVHASLPLRRHYPRPFRIGEVES